MLYDFSWLEAGQSFPPICEQDRLTRYRQNRDLFNLEHFKGSGLRVRDDSTELPVDVYSRCAERISQVVGNFDDIISFPVLLGYQRLMTLKTADLVCGEYPTITGVDDDANQQINDTRDEIGFDDKMYSTVIDLSRYGDSIWRLYRDEDSGENTFTCWTPTQWFPVVAQDGTNSIIAHCLCWRESLTLDPVNPKWRLHVQIHGCRTADFGHYEYKVFSMMSDGVTIDTLLSSTTVPTGFKCCAVIHNKAFSVTDSVYGYDDYMPIDSVLAEIMVRVGQISAILDKHAEPNMTGPVSMLTVDPKTGERKLAHGKFYGISPGEDYPKYLTWDGQLEAAFKQLEFLINQLYILSEMGSALIGSKDEGSTAISGTAMRFKLVNPLAKARRIANSMSRSVRKLFANLCPDVSIKLSNVSVEWADGLPDDPREQIESCKLATGETTLMPLEDGIIKYFKKSPEEARKWIDEIDRRAKEKQEAAMQRFQQDPNKPGPQDGTGVNPNKKGSETGLNNFHGLNNGG